MGGFAGHPGVVIIFATTDSHRRFAPPTSRSVSLRSARLSTRAIGAHCWAKYRAMRSIVGCRRPVWTLGVTGVLECELELELGVHSTDRMVPPVPVSVRMTSADRGE